MKKPKEILTVIMFCIFAIATVSTALAGGHYRFSCNLYESKVGPKPARTEATGVVLFHHDESKQEISYQLRVKKIQGVYMAHLHIGELDKEGPLAAWLYPLREYDQANRRVIEEELNGTLADGVIRQEDLKNDLALEDLIESLRSGDAYVNVHTKNFIMGELRGQVNTDRFVGLLDEEPGC